MNLTLKRNKFSKTGIFGQIEDESGGHICVTLEHSYNCAPKIPPGTYKCVRGTHQLAGASHPFETFEITGVVGHSGLLFHAGNYNVDSSGCVLVGETVVSDMITSSRRTFERFMDLQEGEDSFTLTVL